MTRGKKMLFGCLGGCGFFLLVFVGSCVGFTVWIRSPGEVLQPELLLGPDTVGYLEWTLRLEDPGTAEFAEALLGYLGDLDRKQDSPLPDGIEQILNARQMRSARKDMKRLFPIVVAWNARPGAAADEEEHLFSASARGVSHQMMLADWILGLFLGRADDIDVVRHGREKIYLFRASGGIRPAAFIRRGIVFVSTDLDAATRALDRVTVSGGSPAANREWAELFGSLDAASPLRGAVTNRRGEWSRVLEILDLPDGQRGHPAWAEVRGATLSAGFRDQDVFGGAVELHGPNATWARENEAALGAGLAAWFDRSDIEFVLETSSAGDRIRVEFASKDLFGEIQTMIEDASR